MAESVFAMQLVNLRSDGPKFKENAHFEALNLYLGKKG